MIQAILTWLTGPWGAGLITIFVLIGIMKMGAHHRLELAAWPIGAGAAFYSIAYIGSTWLTAGIR